jgi:hypothetical protein
MTEEEEHEIKRLLESRNIREVNQLAQELSQEISQMETKIIHSLISQNTERAMKDAVGYLNLVLLLFRSHSISFLLSIIVSIIVLLVVV